MLYSRMQSYLICFHSVRFVKCSQNFSNYSAFHYRSKVLESCLLKYANTDTIVKGLNKVEVVRSELEMVCQAAFTEPEDQSAWWYHRFVLDWAERALIDKQSLSEFKQVQACCFICLLKLEYHQVMFSEADRLSTCFFSQLLLCLDVGE